MTTHNTNDCLCNESILNGNEVDNNCPVHNLEDDLLINNQQTSSNCVQGGEVGDTVKKNETHNSSFSSPADNRTLSKEEIEFNLGSAYEEGFQKAQELEKEKVRRLKEWAWGLPTYEGRVANRVIDSIFGSELAGEEE